MCLQTTSPWCKLGLGDNAGSKLLPGAWSLLVPEVVRFKIAKAILLVILLIVALNSCGQWFLASRTFSNTPAKTFRDKGCIWWRVTGFGTLPFDHSCVTNCFRCKVVVVQSNLG